MAVSFVSNWTVTISGAGTAAPVVDGNGAKGKLPGDLVSNDLRFGRDLNMRNQLDIVFDPMTVATPTPCMRTDAFTHIGAKLFSGVAGPMRRADGTLQGDVNGDDATDFYLHLVGGLHAGGRRPDRVIRSPSGCAGHRATLDPTGGQA